MMQLRRHLFRKVTIIGVGLIGGSLGLAIKKHQLAREVVGLSQNPASLDLALKLQAIDQGFQDVQKAVHNADLIILATPVGSMAGVLKTIRPYLRRHCLVTDVGSVKASITQVAQDVLADAALFVGSHPLAGSEKKGVQNASADLFQNSICIMTPVEKTNRMVIDRVRRLWTACGAKVKTMPPEEHDKILAYISHLPHLSSFALMDTIPDSYLAYAAQGLKDTTRIASSSPQLWSEICLDNSKNLIRALDEMVDRLAALRKALLTNDSKTVLNLLQSGKNKKDKITDHEPQSSDSRRDN